MTTQAPDQTGTTARYVAFAGATRLAEGSLAQVDAAARRAHAAPGAPPVLMFDRTTGAVVDLDLREPGPDTTPAPTAARRGRPKLGVTAREVTLLPRHWEWLARQPGGASAALRRLVETARKAKPEADAARARAEAAYRFMSAMAGDLSGFEEAIRALFADDHAALATHTAAWPTDIRDEALRAAAPPPPPEPLTQRLRRETAAAHERLEASLDLLADPSPARLRVVLARFLGFHRTWEAAVAPLIAPETGGDDTWFTARRRVAALEHDLALLGLTPAEIAALPAPTALEWLTDADAAWGSLYVMEGSTLGGQVIGRAVREHGVEGLLYFDGRGRDAGAMWRDLRARLDARAGDGARVAAGAGAAFEGLRVWMTGMGVE